MKNTLSFFCLIINLLSFAGGWVQPKGSGYFQLSQRVLVANQIFSDWGEITNFRTIGNYTTSFYGEYGITDRFTMVADAPLFIRNTLNEEVDRNGNIINEGRSVNNIGDVTLALKYGIKTEGSLVFNTGIFLGLPTGTTDSQSNIPLPTGDGEFNQMIKVEAGYGFGNRLYSVAGLGYNNRTKGYSDDIRYDLELGYSSKFIARLKISGIISTFNGNATSTASALYSNNVEHFTINPEVGYFVSESTGIALGIAGGNGRNVHAAPYFTLSAFVKI